MISQQHTLDGKPIEKKFGEGRSRADWMNFYSDCQDHEEMVYIGLQAAGIPI